ncbi:hypothetical protein LJC37_05060 [Bacteroidales bacterium OttesenSCG-928-E04]|nr:hypothetical protein [Bacteroidales bacterium OttesenSCG-928-E04]
MDPTGEYIVGTDGKAVSYSRGENGTIVWSKNASKDVQRVGNSMLQTQTGTEWFDKMRDAKHSVNIEIDNTEQTHTNLGSCEITMPDGSTDPNDVKKAKITIFEQNIVKQIKEAPNKYGDFTVNEMIGSVGGHEGVHGTDENNLWNAILINLIKGADTDGFFLKSIEIKPNRVGSQILQEIRNAKKITD